MGVAAKLPEMLFSHQLGNIVVKNQGGQLYENFQIFVVSAVKISKQCLQTTSVSGGLCSRRAATGESPLDLTRGHPTRGLPSLRPTAWVTPPKLKFLAPPLLMGVEPITESVID